MVNFITLPRDKALEIIDDESEGYTLVENTLSGKSRWCDVYDLIFQENSSGKFFRGDYRIGATESQDESPWEYQKEVNFYEVEPYTVVVTKFKTKDTE
jgi:hypothetical protein